ncbi:MAG: imidazole glycerol phosphate synthase subunit HisH [Nitrospina sp.]|jgi:imidazole glycerol-phosphate synthase subunit HisH|nr:imidazole glycerol phosphate synthase subunit HisH [Nitrospina sp.]
MKNKSPLLVIDSGIGNLASVANMIRKIGGEAKFSSSPDEIRQAQKLILPGVGSYDVGINALRERSLDIAVKTAVKENGSMLLGICLGMQLLFESSEEGNQPGLGLIQGHVRSFQLSEQSLRVPHMGWNVVRPKWTSKLLNVGDEQRFYFVHSFHADCTNAEDVSATTLYGYDFVSAVERGNVMGVQFHPEKSHRFGMALFKRFWELPPC